MGSAENKEKDTYQQTIDLINDNLDIKIGDIDIDRSHRVGRYDKVNQKARSIIVTFSRYNVGGNVFCEKWKLKDTGKSIKESLAKKKVLAT